MTMGLASLLPGGCAALLLVSGQALYLLLRRDESTLSGYLFVLIAMARNLNNSPSVNSSLCVPPGFAFMDVRGLGRYLFVRPCYVSLFDIIFTKMIPKGMELITITGIPGVGKTCFLYYVLCTM